MSKTLNRQVRLINPNGNEPDPIAFDGAPLSAHMLSDMPQNLNNMASYCDPCFQFLFNATENGTGVKPTWWVRGNSSMPVLGSLAVSGSGAAFLGSAPIIVPTGAKRLLWTLNTVRGNFVAPEIPVSIDITGINLWLSPFPLTKMIDGKFMEYPASSGEYLGLVNQSCFSRYALYSHAVGFSSGGSGGPIKEFASDISPGWTDFMKDPAVVQWNRFGAPAPVAYLTVTAEFAAAAVGDYIKAREFSIWGQYE